MYDKFQSLLYIIMRKLHSKYKYIAFHTLHDGSESNCARASFFLILSYAIFVFPALSRVLYTIVLFTEVFESLWKPDFLLKIAVFSVSSHTLKCIFAWLPLLSLHTVSKIIKKSDSVEFYKGANRSFLTPISSNFGRITLRLWGIPQTIPRIPLIPLKTGK